MKKKTKNKTVSGSAKKAQPQVEMPDLVSALMKLTERLEAVERKMDALLNRPSDQPQRPIFHNPQQHSQNHPPQNFNRAPQPQIQNLKMQNPQGQTQNSHRPHHGKPMFPAVCADCKKNCEVPFLPTGERPTYCKECFSKRKSAGRPNSNPQIPNANLQNLPVLEKRQIKVVSNGVGKTVISEMVPAAASKKSVKPAKKSKK